MRTVWDDPQVGKSWHFVFLTKGLLLANKKSFCCSFHGWNSQVYLNFSATPPEILDGKAARVHAHEVDAKGFEITCMSYKMYLSTIYNTSMCVCIRILDIYIY